jgi:hypothetical protein
MTSRAPEASRSRLEASRVRGTIELHRKFSIPFACIVFLMVGVRSPSPFAGSTLARFLDDLGLIFLYYIPLTVGQTLAEKGYWPAAIDSWCRTRYSLRSAVSLHQGRTKRRSPARAPEVLRMRA